MAIRNDNFEENIDDLFGSVNDINEGFQQQVQGDMGYNQQYVEQDYAFYNAQNQNQQGYVDNYDQYYQQPNYQQQGYTQNQKHSKVKEKINQLAEDGVTLNNKIIGVLLGIIGLIVVLIVMGLFNFANKPKTQKVVKQVPKTVTTTTTTNTTEDINSVKMTIVGDNVSIDYSTAIIESTGLVTAKNKYLLNGQVVYSLGISITVGNEQKQIEHFCNYNTYKVINTGEVLNVKYQQVSNTVLSVCDITK